MILHILDTETEPVVGSRITANCGEVSYFTPIHTLLDDGQVCNQCAIQHKQHKLSSDFKKSIVIVDRNFICGGCGGIIVQVGKRPDGRRVFNCSQCHANEMLECTNCHFPRSIWADDGELCGVCVLDAMAGKRELTKKHLEGIKKWTIIIDPDQLLNDATE